MGKIGVMVYTLVVKRCFDLYLVLIPEACCWNPFPMGDQFAFCSKVDDIILFQVIHLEERLVVIPLFVT